MCALPREPTQNICLIFQRGGPQPAAGMLRCHIEQDGIRFPKDETIVLQGRHFLIGVEAHVLRSTLIARSKINRLNGEHASCWKQVELHTQHSLELSVTAAAHAAGTDNSVHAKGACRLVSS